MLGLVVVVLGRSLTFDVETQWSLDGFSISGFGHFDSDVFGYDGILQRSSIPSTVPPVGARTPYTRVVYVRSPMST